MGQLHDLMTININSMNGYTCMCIVSLICPTLLLFFAPDVTVMVNWA